MKLPAIACSLALLAFAPSALACGHHAGGGSGLFSQLDLTAAQKTEIAQIRHSAVAPKVKHAEILAVLTPAQKAELKQLRANRKV